MSLKKWLMGTSVYAVVAGGSIAIALLIAGPPGWVILGVATFAYGVFTYFQARRDEDAPSPSPADEAPEVPFDPETTQTQPLPEEKVKNDLTATSAQSPFKSPKNWLKATAFYAMVAGGCIAVGLLLGPAGWLILGLATIFYGAYTYQQLRGCGNGPDDRPNNTPEQQQPSPFQSTHTRVDNRLSNRDNIDSPTDPHCCLNAMLCIGAAFAIVTDPNSEVNNTHNTHSSDYQTEYGGGGDGSHGDHGHGYDDYGGGGVDSADTGGGGDYYRPPSPRQGLGLNSNQ